MRSLLQQFHLKDKSKVSDSTTRGRGSSGAHPHGWQRAETRQTRSGSGRASRSGGRQTQQLQLKQEPSLAVKISLEATELPSVVWLGATPFTVQAFAAPVRRTLGHSNQQCWAKQTRCSKCGKGSHSHEQCDAQVFSCVNCNSRHSVAYKGCPEMQIRQRANLLRRQTYLPYNVAMQRARDKMKPKAPPPAQPASPAVDNCWSRDRTAPSSLSADTGTLVSYGRVAATGGTANWDLFRSLPGTAEINVGDADLDEVNRRIVPSILEAAREAIPVTGGGLSRSNSNPWWNKECEEAVRLS